MSVRSTESAERYFRPASTRSCSHSSETSCIVASRACHSHLSTLQQLADLLLLWLHSAFILSQSIATLQGDLQVMLKGHAEYIEHPLHHRSDLMWH